MLSLSQQVLAGPIPGSAQHRLVLFAECAGRFSAQMEHDWLLGRDGEGPREARHQMVSLIEAIGPLPDLTGSQLLALRIDSKMAHAALLTRATFGQQPRARAMARQHLELCAALLPSEIDLASLR